MKFLVDTNVIIDYWKCPRDEVKKVFSENEVYLSGIVIAEALHGAKNAKDFEKIKRKNKKHFRKV